MKNENKMKEIQNMIDLVSLADTKVLIMWFSLIKKFIVKRHAFTRILKDKIMGTRNNDIENKQNEKKGGCL